MNRSFPIITAALAASLSLAGCITTTPPTSVHQPMSARPPVAAVHETNNGAIYQANSGQRTFFEDRRARYVGDTLTINIVENTSADKKSNTTTNRSSDNNFAVGTVQGLPGKSFQGANLGATSDFKASGDGASASRNVFTGVITVTVTDVLPNGNLLVSGEKQIGINQGSEFIRFSGVVNPVHLSAVNTVNSVQVADARIEYRGNGQLEGVQAQGWLARFFMRTLPF